MAVEKIKLPFDVKVACSIVFCFSIFIAVIGGVKMFSPKVATPENGFKEFGKWKCYEYHGGFIYLDVTESRMMAARSLGKYEKFKVRLIDEYLAEGETFIDIGAHVGYFTLQAAKIVGPKGKVLAFEPFLSNVAWIDYSKMVNGYTQIYLFEIALGHKQDIVKFYTGEMSGWGSVRDTSRANFINVYMYDLDSIIGRNLTQASKNIIGRLCPIPKVDRVHMIKLDAEGADLSILKGAEWILRKWHPIIVMDTNYPQYITIEEVKEMMTYLRSLGYEIYDERRPNRVLERYDVTAFVAREAR